MGAVDAALAPVGHALDAHDLLMIGAVVVHHVEDRQAADGGRPQDARRIHQIAVGIDRDGDAAMLLVGDRGARRRRRAIADAGAAGDAGVVIMLAHVPQPLRPAADEIAGGRGQRPILVADRLEHLGAEPAGRDRARVPGEQRVLAGRCSACLWAAASFSPRASNFAFCSALMHLRTASVR